MVWAANVEGFSVEGENLTSQEELGRESRNREYGEDALVFYSSGGGKKIGLSPADQELLIEGFEETFREAGVIESDVPANWGAPDPEHMSQWSFREGTQFMQDNVDDSVADPLERGYNPEWEDVTVLLSMPRPLKSVGEKLQEEYGNLEELFPNARMSLTSGDTMPESLRTWIEQNYGIRAKNFYAGTEIGMAGVEVENGVYKPTNPNLILEILDEDAEVGEEGQIDEEDIYRLEELDVGQRVSGPIAVSAPLREELPFTRYRVGDVWTAWRSDEGVRMSFEGREDNVILYSGANLYPEEIDDAVRDIADVDWKLVPAEEDDYVNLNFYLPGGYIPEEELEASLAENNKTYGSWRITDAMELNVSIFDPENWRALEEELEEKYELPRDDDGDIILLNDLRGKSPKRQRIARDRSTYSAT